MLNQSINIDLSALFKCSYIHTYIHTYNLLTYLLTGYILVLSADHLRLVIVWYAVGYFMVSVV